MKVISLPEHVYNLLREILTVQVSNLNRQRAKWMVYFTVKNMDESVAKVKSLGGVVYMQKDISVGKIAIIADPTQAGLVLMELSVPPTEWVE